jgi:hypothetical protein
MSGVKLVIDSKYPDALFRQIFRSQELKIASLVSLLCYLKYVA